MRFFCFVRECLWMIVSEWSETTHVCLVKRVALDGFKSGTRKCVGYPCPLISSRLLVHHIAIICGLLLHSLSSQKGMQLFCTLLLAGTRGLNEEMTSHNPIESTSTPWHCERNTLYEKGNASSVRWNTGFQECINWCAEQNCTRRVFILHSLVPDSFTFPSCWPMSIFHTYI